MSNIYRTIIESVSNYSELLVPTKGGTVSDYISIVPKTNNVTNIAENAITEVNGNTVTVEGVAIGNGATHLKSSVVMKIDVNDLKDNYLMYHENHEVLSKLLDAGFDTVLSVDDEDIDDYE